MKTLAYFLPPAEGIVWLRKAADLGHFQAQVELPDYEKIHATVLKPGEQVRIGVRSGSPAAPRPASSRPAWKYPVGSILRNVGTSNPGCNDVYVEAHSNADNLYYVVARYGGGQRSDWSVQTSPSRVFKQGTLREEDLDKEFKLVPGARYCKKCQGTGDFILQQIRSGYGGGRFHYGEWKEYTPCKDCAGLGI